MQFKTAAVLASLPALVAVAAPTGSSGLNPDATFPSVYGLVIGTDVQPFHFESVNANSGKFWLNLPETATSCPFAGTADAANCPTPGNSTAFTGAGSMAVVVPGGQQVYVAPSGALMFTEAHTAAIPDGSVTEPFTFSLEPNAQYGVVGTNALGADGFMACPTEGSIAYQVFANVATAEVPLGNVDDCVVVQPLAIPYTLGTAAAWQYD
jgi:hypothetical protein